MPLPLRILAVGFPKTGKDGALAALLNTGIYRVRVIDFEENTLPIYSYTRPEFHKNIAVATVRDKLGMGDVGPIGSKGTPTAFRNAWKLIDEFKFVDRDGVEQNLGPVKSWGLNDILVVDGITQMGEAGMRRVLAMNNRSILNRRIQEWGMVQNEISLFFDNLKALAPCHIYAISHLKSYEPRTVEENDEKGITSSMAAQINEQIVNTTPVRLLPTVPGTNLAQVFAGLFPIVIHFDTEFVGEKHRQIIRTVPSLAVRDVGVPAAGLPPKLPLEDGLVTIFRALGQDVGDKRQAA